MQTFIFPVSVWLFLCIRSGFYLVFLEVAMSAPYVCKYKHCPNIGGLAWMGHEGATSARR